MPIAFDLETPQSYFDDQGKPLRLYLDTRTLFHRDVMVRLHDVPLLKGDGIAEPFFPDRTKYLIDQLAQDALERGNNVANIGPLKRPNIRYPIAEAFEFSYSCIDYDFIPGLRRSLNNGYLCPVFFNIGVLIKYAQNSNYGLDLFSETYGTIRQGEEWSIEFGITRSKKVIMWLGDIAKLPDREKHYLKSENIESDHDIHSEFYNAQIEVIWSDPSLKDAAFIARKDFAKEVESRFEFAPFSMHAEAVSTLENTEAPIFWDKKHVAAYFNFLNQLFVEGLNSSDIHGCLTKHGVTKKELDGKKGLKLLELFATRVLGIKIEENVIKPFFVLNDVRQVCSHYLGSTEAELHQSIYERLSLPKAEAFDFEAVNIALLKDLRKSCETLIAAMSALPLIKA